MSTGVSTLSKLLIRILTYLIIGPIAGAVAFGIMFAITYTVDTIIGIKSLYMPLVSVSVLAIGGSIYLSSEMAYKYYINKKAPPKTADK